MPLVCADCKQTAGYISNAELDSIIANSSIPSSQYTDTESNSNILVYDSNWAAYMTEENKQLRQDSYSMLNFAGTTVWAIDLQQFTDNFNIQEKLAYGQTDWSTLSCTETQVNNTALDPLSRWEAAGCDTAWDAFLEFWDSSPYNGNGDNGATSFSNAGATFFHLRPNLECQDLVAYSSAQTCLPTTSCDNGADIVPAGQFITNSMIMIWMVKPTHTGDR